MERCKARSSKRDARPTCTIHINHYKPLDIGDNSQRFLAGKSLTEQTSSIIYIIITKRTHAIEKIEIVSNPETQPTRTHACTQCYQIV